MTFFVARNNSNKKISWTNFNQEHIIVNRSDYYWLHAKVQILLLFIHAQRDGVWKLHLHAFQHTLPLFMKYDYTNYACWDTIYLNEMH